MPVAFRNHRFPSSTLSTAYRSCISAAFDMTLKGIPGWPTSSSTSWTLEKIFATINDINLVTQALILFNSNSLLLCFFFVQNSLTSYHAILRINTTHCTSGGSHRLSALSSSTSAAKLSSITSRRRWTCRLWIRWWKWWSMDCSRILSSVCLSKKYGVYLIYGTVTE